MGAGWRPPAGEQDLHETRRVPLSERPATPHEGRRRRRVPPSKAAPFPADNRAALRCPWHRQDLARAAEPPPHGVEPPSAEVAVARARAGRGTLSRCSMERPTARSSSSARSAQSTFAGMAGASEASDEGGRRAQASAREAVGGAGGAAGREGEGAAVGAGSPSASPEPAISLLSQSLLRLRESINQPTICLCTCIF